MPVAAGASNRACAAPSGRVSRHRTRLSMPACCRHQNQAKPLNPYRALRSWSRTASDAENFRSRARELATNASGRAICGARGQNPSRLALSRPKPEILQMRQVQFMPWIAFTVLSLVMTACADPKCRPGERRVASMCFPIPKTDGGPDVPDPNQLAEDATADSAFGATPPDDEDDDDSTPTRAVRGDGAAEVNPGVTREQPADTGSTPAASQTRCAPENCVDPGQCKVKACSDSGVCQPLNAADHTDCRIGGRSGVCSGGQCVSCVDDSDCTRLSPDTPRCAEGNCVECVSADADCAASTCRKAICIENLCGYEQTPWAECAPARVCNESGACTAACPNGHIDPGDECEVGVDGWSYLSCEESTCQRFFYRRCAVSSQCGERNCGTGQVCSATGCSTAASCPPGPPNAVVICYGSTFCVLGCDNDDQCPSGLVCAPDNVQTSGRTGLCVGDPSCCSGGNCANCFWPVIGQ